MISGDVMTASSELGILSVLGLLNTETFTITHQQFQKFNFNSLD